MLHMECIWQGLKYRPVAFTSLSALLHGAMVS
jgi:hypothetical protein